MPLITQRDEVLEVFAEAGRNAWVIPAFGVENLTTVEAVLSAARQQGEALGRPDLPVMLAMTNRYPERTQSAYYTHTRQWRLGLELFLADIGVLTGAGSPFGGLRVLLHLDHIQHDLDEELWRGDLSRFSSLMFDASGLPFEENIAATRRFVRERGHEIVIEGACDHIGGDSHLTTQEEAERFCLETGVDWVVPNLGTEHRAGVSALRYARERAREISQSVGRRLVLHGTSSVSPEQLPGLAADGIAKVNLWTALERDTSGHLLREMARRAGKVAGSAAAEEMLEVGLLGPEADTASPAALSYFTTAWRQQLVFERMKRIVKGYLEAWFPA
ncbi:class II fructose-bisphosphate aldolase [Ruficoccus amylovorans]|uniref:Class II fructose-bisphosphate aldolase n=1 Tax=Ruficoccus amylovorans TaxID=1804625 RepID=A0A842HJT9_9BACT|nr:class II fructose-bisphosphate aldolase [Ruficoccus amylovorans]MBC2595914.1 class II fructose-bisphosphate aldolase [Ruficoccus amylovorans]